MSQAVQTERFTVGVFQDPAWAERGVRALLEAGFASGSLTLLAVSSGPIDGFFASVLGGPPRHLDIKNLGSVSARGPLVDALQGRDLKLERLGLAAAIDRAGFQPHDGYIFETLVGRGGVLAAISSEARAADALAKLHAYGGGNAGIGAWTGRV